MRMGAVPVPGDMRRAKSRDRCRRGVGRQEERSGSCAVPCMRIHQVRTRSLREGSAVSCVEGRGDSGGDGGASLEGGDHASYAAVTGSALFRSISSSCGDVPVVVVVVVVEEGGGGRRDGGTARGG
jgi:hypothetical protein